MRRHGNPRTTPTNQRFGLPSTCANGWCWRGSWCSTSACASDVRTFFRSLDAPLGNAVRYELREVGVGSRKQVQRALQYEENTRASNLGVHVLMDLKGYGEERAVSFDVRFPRRRIPPRESRRRDDADPWTQSSLTAAAGSARGLRAVAGVPVPGCGRRDRSPARHRPLT